ncbi:hypothetical protein M513_06175 [Trichuris suis]|uniref:Uncharacterized protein n=1 Tax=Trichuris suis TaxID=68888 RepID=A0A085M6L9_9BILA|nr:hypothetical protein M513_06175 [Trichuris suis]
MDRAISYTLKQHQANMKTRRSASKRHHAETLAGRGQPPKNNSLKVMDETMAASSTVEYSTKRSFPEEDRSITELKLPGS